MASRSPLADRKPQLLRVITLPWTMVHGKWTKNHFQEEISGRPRAHSLWETFLSLAGYKKKMSPGLFGSTAGNGKISEVSNTRDMDIPPSFAKTRFWSAEDTENCKMDLFIGIIIYNKYYYKFLIYINYII